MWPFKPKQIKESKTSVVVMGGGQGVVWSDKRYDVFARETYLKNVIAFRAIDMRAKAFASVPWAVFRQVDDEIIKVEQHPFNKVIKRPNPKESFAFIMLKLNAFFVMAGNAYLERVALMTGINKGIPKELYVQRPDRMKVLKNPNTGQLRGYQYDVGMGQKVNWEVNPVTEQSDILHFLSFHPLDDWYGAAPTEALSREIDTSNEATRWNKKILENEGRPGMVVTITGDVAQAKDSGGILSDDQFEKLEQQLNRKYAGAENAGRNLILEGGKGTQATPYGFSPQELDFIEGNRELARRIAFGYGVPPQLVGIPGDTTYSNMEAAELAFWEKTVIWDLSYFKGELNAWLFPKEDFFLDYDLNDVSALIPRREMKWKRAQESDFLTINEKREMVGKEAIDGGDEILVPATMIPLGMEIEAEPEEEEKALLDEGFTKKEVASILGYSPLKVVK